jgi:hypothetical protein
MPEAIPKVAKSGIDRLLIESALHPDLRRRLLESPDEVFADFELSEYEKDILRRPDHRLLDLLGAALARQTEPARCREAGESAVAEPVPASPAETRTLPGPLLALTIVPCALQNNGQFAGITYAVWVSPMAEGADPASLPPPAGAVLPGQPFAPLYAVIELSAIQSQDAAGNLQVGLWGSFRQATNVAPPPPPETAGNPGASPFGSRLDSEPVQAAAAAVRQAPGEERYGKLVDLMHVLRGGDVR